MENLEIEATYTTPKVIFNPTKSHFLICGSSIIENADEFYSPLINWMDSYLMSRNPEKLEFTFDIKYFNASSSRRILKLVKKLKRIKDNGGTICINWLYCEKDQSVYEIGQDFSSMLNLPFNFIDQSTCCDLEKDAPFSVN